MRRLYVLLSKDLEPIYACVQGGHAVAQWMLDNREAQGWNNEYLVYLYADVEKWSYKLTLMGRRFSSFREPDLDGKLTSIALVDDGRLFRNLKTVKERVTNREIAS